jgi:hypothetical protein
VLWPASWIAVLWHCSLLSRALAGIFELRGTGAAEQKCFCPHLATWVALLPAGAADGDAAAAREGYALAAGFGLGLICLGQGRNAPGLADLHLEDKLRWVTTTECS